MYQTCQNNPSNQINMDINTRNLEMYNKMGQSAPDITPKQEDYKNNK